MVKGAARSTHPERGHQSPAPGGEDSSSASDAQCRQPTAALLALAALLCASLALDGRGKHMTIL